MVVAFSIHLYLHSPCGGVTNVSSRHSIQIQSTDQDSIYVGYPRIAQNAVNDAQIQLVSMSIENPTPESVDLSFKQVFNTNSSYHPTLYPFNASFYLLDQQYSVPFGSIETTEIRASNGAGTDFPLQRMNISQMDRFTKYVSTTLSSEEFTIALRGHGDLKEGALPKTSITYDKNITMKGMIVFLAHSSRSFAHNSRLQPLEWVFHTIFPSYQRNPGRRD